MWLDFYFLIFNRNDSELWLLKELLTGEITPASQWDMKDMRKDECPICKSDISYPIQECDCGFSFEKIEITNDAKLRTLYSKLKVDKNWVEQVKIVRAVLEIQQKKHGKAYSGRRGGWSLKKTGKMLLEQTSTISDSINLAYGMDVYPELSKCKNKNEAKIRFKELGNAGFFSAFLKKFNSERNLQEYLETHWNETPFGKEWDLKEAKFNAGSVGQIDLLAQHQEKPKWLVIELKKDTSPDNTIGQILRYMGWIKKNHAGKDEEVEGLIISGFPPDDWIRNALLVTPNVKQRIYYCFENAVAKFIDENLVDTLLKFTKRPIDEQIKIWKRLEG